MGHPEGGEPPPSLVVAFGFGLTEGRAVQLGWVRRVPGGGIVVVPEASVDLLVDEQHVVLRTHRGSYVMGQYAFVSEAAPQNA